MNFKVEQKRVDFPMTLCIGERLRNTPELDHYVTQFLTEHGEFNSKLNLCALRDIGVPWVLWIVLKAHPLQLRTVYGAGERPGVVYGPPAPGKTCALLVPVD